MGKKDSVTIQYMRKESVFADIFNFAIYGGEQVLSERDLRDLDTREILAYSVEGERKPQTIERIRDIVKEGIEGDAAYAIFVLENQSDINYAMPVRTMTGDSIRYTNQVNRVIERHKRAGDYKKVKSANFISGFMKGDRVIPVVTLIVLFSPDEWDGPRSLHEMFDIEDKEMLAMVPDYKLNIISPESLSEEDIKKLNSTLRQVFSFIKYSNDKEKLMELITTDEAFQHLGWEEVNVLKSCSNIKIPINEDEEEINMCKAIQDLMDDAAREATEKAEKKAEKALAEAAEKAESAEKKAESAEKKAASARSESFLQSIRSLKETLHLEPLQAMAALKIPEHEQARYLKLLEG